MIKLKNPTILIVSLLLLLAVTSARAAIFNDNGSIAEGQAAGSGDGGSNSGQCEADDFYNKLSNSESGGCGGGNQYNCMGPVIKSGMHAGDRPLGKYQFMPKTLRGMGINPNGFVGNAAAQEAAIRQFTSQNDACLQRSGAYNYIGQVRNGVTITKSGLLGAAHLGGCGGASKWAKGGGGASDQLGTSMADYAAKFGGYNMFGAGTDGECGAGVANAADQFAQAQASGLVGCDPAIQSGNETKVQALRQQESEAARALITKPASVQQLTCFDQYAKSNADEIGKIHSNPSAGISDSISPIVEQPNMQYVLKNFMSSVLGGGLQSMLNSAMSSLTGGLTGGGSATSGCQAMDEMWKLLQCVDFPEMPNLSDIIGGSGGGLGGVLSSLGGSGGLGSIASGLGGGGGGVMGAVCQAMKGAMGGGGSGATSAFEDLANELKSTSNNNETSEDYGNDDEDSCDYEGIAQAMANMDADLNGNNIIEAKELTYIDISQGNNNCLLESEEIQSARDNYVEGSL